MNNSHLSFTDQQAAIKQYIEHGRIIPCSKCESFVSDANGYGFCGTRIVKSSDWCSRAKDRNTGERPKPRAALVDCLPDDHDVSGLLEE